MHRTQTITDSLAQRIKLKLKDYYILVKFRLSFIVVFSAGVGYLFAGGEMSGFSMFLIAGFLITAASNTLNQIIEQDTDKLMVRTADRPLAAKRMTNTEAIISAGVMATAGIALMWYFFNPMAALLGALSLLSYAFIYTPVKRISPISVFIGAFPGAIPPVIGCAAATGTITTEALVLFAIQFFWQFPHFWSIAWVAYDDYANAGFYLLPSSSGRTKASAFHIVTYTVLLLPVSMLPFMLNMTGNVSAMIVLLTGLFFLYQAAILYRTSETKHARALMFGSFLYLPVVLIALLMDKI
ncbi:MAG: heme o synthase [Chitinophagales bacterium]